MIVIRRAAIVGVCGIAAFPEHPGPGVIVGHVKVKQLQIARATQKKGVVVKTLLWRVVYAETFVGRVVVAKHLPPFPFFVAFNAEMVVALRGEGASPGGAFKQPLCQGDRGRDAIFALMLHGKRGITRYIIFIRIARRHTQGQQCKTYI